VVADVSGLSEPVSSRPQPRADDVSQAKLETPLFLLELVGVA
jgi:hypothetical protein